jgi:hypothetical protein
MTDAGAERRAIAFEGARCLASGPLPDVARAVKAAHDRGAREPVLVFDAESSTPIEIDVRGTPEEVVARLTPAAAEPEARRGPGRPKLGVVAREVTLLPRHWEWLATQPGGASVALRRLVEDARRASQGRDRVRVAREAAYRFMSALAGDEAGFEEATRARFAGDRARFETHLAAWPPDVRAHANTRASTPFDAETEGRP